jgi:hypothetical protein
MGEGNGIRPVHCKGRYGTNGISVCSMCSIPACFWIMDSGFRLSMFAELRRRASIPQETQNPQLRFLSFVSFVSFVRDGQALLGSRPTEPIRWPLPPLPKAKSQKSQTSQFCVCDFSFFLDR